MKNTERILSAARGGFTLVELLLVIVILGMLAAVAVVNLEGVRGEAGVGATRASIAAIKEAADVYEIRTGKYPDSIEALTQSVGDRPPLLEKKPQDGWGNDFQLRRKDKGIEIRSAGPDGSFNTQDDITN